MNCSSVFTYLYDNRVAIETGAIILVTAAIRVLPPPGTPFKLYDYFYDLTHQLFNISDGGRIQRPLVSKEEPKK